MQRHKPQSGITLDRDYPSRTVWEIEQALDKVRECLVGWEAAADRRDATAATSKDPLDVLRRVKPLIERIHENRLGDDDGACDCGECSQCLARRAELMIAEIEL